MRRSLLLGSTLALVALCAPAGALAETAEVGSGPLRAVVTADPWRVELLDAGGATVLRERVGAGLGVRGTTGDLARATRATRLARDGEAVVATVQTSDAARTLRVRIAPDGDGVLRLTALAQGGTAASAVAMGFDARPGERFFGFGERSNHVDMRGQEVENYVADGPFPEGDRTFVKPTTPPYGARDRDDSTYFPIPWLLSGRGYGVLIDNDETSAFRLAQPGAADAWELEAQAPELRLRFFGGPRPADALRRFTAAVGRQPPPPTPWTFGPWFQTGQKNKIPLEEEAAETAKLRAADAPVSVAETQMHFLPCGAHRGEADYNRKRTDAFHAAGLAHLVYFNPHLCASYQPVFDEATRAGVLQRTPGGGPVPFTYPAFVGGSEPAGFSSEPLAQFDWTSPATSAFYERLLREAFDTGHDGWMEDFGEYTSPDVVSADGTPGSQIHNRYPRDYHCGVYDITKRLNRPVVRFQRSGWTGAARCAVNVWGGDPTTVFGYDGLSSAVKQALSMGLSGVSRWGTDIGGYFSFGPAETLTPELLKRWIEFGSVAGVMRTKGSGLAFPSYRRPQIFDDDVLPVWKRYAKLHTQLYPYILAADAHYRRTGLPLMQHLGLAYPDDDRAAAQEDEFLFGPDLLAAPVITAGATQRAVYAPAGTWVDLWRSVAYDPATGGFELRAPRLLQGGREHTLPAPLDELPLLARAGALIATLPPDVDTLAEYGSAPGLVHLSDRRDAMRVLAFPRGRSTATFNETERLGSTEGVRRRSWTLTISGARRRTYSVQASLGTLRRPFTPRRVLIGSRVLKRSAWRYDRATEVLRVDVSVKRGMLRVR